MNTKKRGAPTDSKGTAQGETDPHTGNMTEQKRERQIRAQGTKIIQRRNAIMQRKKCNSHTLTTKRMAIK